MGINHSSIGHVYFSYCFCKCGALSSADYASLSYRQNLVQWFIFRKHRVPDTSEHTANLKNIVKQDHRFIKKRVCSMLGLKSFRTSSWMIKASKPMYMIKKDEFTKERNLPKIYTSTVRTSSLMSCYLKVNLQFFLFVFIYLHQKRLFPNQF